MPFGSQKVMDPTVGKTSKDSSLLKRLQFKRLLSLESAFIYDSAKLLSSANTDQTEIAGHNLTLWITVENTTSKKLSGL